MKASVISDIFACLAIYKMDKESAASNNPLLIRLSVGNVPNVSQQL